MIHFTPPTWIEINQRAFEHNITQYKKSIGPRVSLGVVVKSNAYGHGLIEIGMLCQKNNSVDWLCTSLLSEALTLRSHGVTKPIVVMSIIDTDPADAITQNIDLMVYTKTALNALNNIGQTVKQKAYVHIKIDTGMSRFGVRNHEAHDLITYALQLPYIAVRGLYTHLAEADNDDETFTRQQLIAFNNVVHELKQNNIKVGHAGTLDTFASGLMIIAISRTATRLMSTLLTLDKKYRATGKLGELTDTGDPTGTVTKTESLLLITHEQIHATLASFGLSYEQTPPIFSALKYEGKRISTLARRGCSLEQLESIAIQKKRTVHVYDLSLHSYNAPFFTINTHVSHGTYIRSLVHDIGNRLESCATTYMLERTQIGPFALEQAVLLADLVTSGSILPYLISVDQFKSQV